LSAATEDTIFPIVLNLTNRQYDVMLVDARGVKLSVYVVNLRLVGQTISIAVSYMAGLLRAPTYR